MLLPQPAAAPPPARGAPAPPPTPGPERHAVTRHGWRGRRGADLRRGNGAQVAPGRRALVRGGRVAWCGAERVSPNEASPKPAHCTARVSVPAANSAATSGSAMTEVSVSVTSSRRPDGGSATPAAASAWAVSESTSGPRTADSSRSRGPSLACSGFAQGGGESGEPVRCARVGAGQLVHHPGGAGGLAQRRDPLGGRRVARGPRRVAERLAPLGELGRIGAVQLVRGGGYPVAAGGTGVSVARLVAVSARRTPFRHVPVMPRFAAPRTDRLRAAARPLCPPPG